MISFENKEPSSHLPMLVLTIDIDCLLPDLSRWEKSNKVYLRALILVRLHKQPIGVMEVDIPEEGLGAAELASQIWEKFGHSICDHAAEDNIPPPVCLEKTGVYRMSSPPCWQRQNDLLANAPFVSVVISTRDRLESLRECLHSVLALDYPNYEVIVVDNAPRSDDTENYIKSTFADLPKVRYVREVTPGLAVAHNRALGQSDAPIIAITDDDVLVDQNWLRAMVSNFQRDPLVGCVTGMILPYELETPPQLWIEEFGGFGKGCKRIVYDMQENRPQDILYPYAAGRFGSGANMAFRASVLKSLGGFDSALGAGTLAKGGDDLAIFFDVVAHGHRLVYEPGAVLFHKHRRDYEGLARQSYGYGVGLSAFLMRTIVKNPKRLMDIALKVPSGLRHILHPRSTKNQKKGGDYPRQLTLLELKGFLVGPLAYLRSWFRAQKTKVDI
jgi:O-antigen biosynthesis protein